VSRSDLRRAHSFFKLLLKEAVAYALYMGANTFLPACVSALVLLYGGNLVLAGQVRGSGSGCSKNT
jgi:hypothetical protein